MWVMPFRPVVRLTLLAFAALAVLASPTAVANTSHQGWPRIDGMLLMNKTDAPRPLDARPGHDPFHGDDRRYSCDAIHRRGRCHRRFRRRRHHRVMSRRAGHNELLGGHGSDTIYAGPWGDVLWGDYKPSGQPGGQVDRLRGGRGKDFIYASHGENLVWAGGGADVIHAHFGHGQIWCGHGRTIVYLSHRSRRGYRLHGCHRISYKTLGY